MRILETTDLSMSSDHRHTVNADLLSTSCWREPTINDGVIHIQDAIVCLPDQFDTDLEPYLRWVVVLDNWAEETIAIRLRIHLVDSSNEESWTLEKQAFIQGHQRGQIIRGRFPFAEVQLEAFSEARIGVQGLHTN